MKKGDKVVCLCEDYEWDLKNFINPGGAPEKGKVYVIESIYGYGGYILGLNFVGGIISINKLFKCMSGFSPRHFRLLSEIQEERKKFELEFSNPS